jgi:hypothetical protein
MNLFDFNDFQGCQRVGKIGESDGCKPSFLKNSSLGMWNAMRRGGRIVRSATIATDRR